MEPAEIAQLIGELEDRVERLRSLYDQYFMGIERLEPTIPRKDVDRRLWLLRREQIRNTGLRFKLETTIQRYNTYQQYWQRIVREIENGTYQRDLGRAARRFGEGAVTAFAKRRQKLFEKGQARKEEREAQRQAKSSQAPPPTEAPAGESYDVAFDDSEFAEDPAPLSLDLGPTFAAAKPGVLPTPPRPRSPGPPTPPARPAFRLTAASPGTMREVPPEGPRLPAPSPPAPAQPRASPPGPIAQPPSPAPRPPAPSQSDARPPAPAAGNEEGLSATRLRQIYGQYVEAKRKANESTAAITYDKVAANLKETAAQLRAKHKGAIDFEVVMKNGKPVLKPVMKG